MEPTSRLQNTFVIYYNFILFCKYSLMVNGKVCPQVIKCEGVLHIIIQGYINEPITMTCMTKDPT